ncbi:MAG: TIGR02678 family protein [Nitriliruptor sp.]|uniref:TIGR02678 family protein n=1 Tax=Nitriliruptor sp. TaxID=2448056 RepID=UPI0034A00425
MSTPSTEVHDRRDQQERHERRRAARALLTSPLLHADRDLDAFRLVRRHADWLRRWFAHEAGWTLTVDTTLARLRKVPATLDDGSRPARARPADPPFSRRRYVLLCLALASLETADRQVALGKLADLIVGSVAADPELGEAGIAFELDTRDQRRDLVAIVRLLLQLGVLRHVDGADADYVAGTGDALYTIDRTALSAVLVARRPPSGVEAVDPDARLVALTAEVAPDTPEAHNRAIRTHLTRRLLDDPVVYLDDLDDEQRAYLTSQRPRLIAAVTEATGLEPEVRAEGIAMVDERGDATDLEVPDQGTDGHLTLLVAEKLARRLRDEPGVVVATGEVEAVVADLITEHADHWRRDVRDAGAEIRLSAEVLDRLAAVGLVRTVQTGVVPRPAIARYVVAAPTLPAAVPSLFEA